MRTSASLFLVARSQGCCWRRGIRDRQWQVLAAAAILLALPVLRNQQYAYVKFYVMWPIPVALLAVRCRTRTVVVAGSMRVLREWLVVDARDPTRREQVTVRCSARIPKRARQRAG